ncbi:isoleucine--tRNA ligase [Candidatus Gottesmanbacteria bacterium]|nr:isoleucine--tRNA ligase [Candidatus Gottesmanbacteria bacterium]
MAETLIVDSFQKSLDISKSEHDVLDFWDETHAFEESVFSRPKDKRYVFYDGPPFATGLPHYGHILASTIKDVIPRYWTMKGYRVERVWGWDCHGIPIENMIEKELELKGGKKGIEALGIDKFNASCRSAILRFDSEWEKIIRRIGRWVDFKHSYKTMDKTYMESVWWAFKSLFEKGLVYEGRRVILYCPRCATPLSNFEIAMDNSYKDVEDNSVYVKFRVKGKKDEYFVAWTTTPWTLIGNVGLAVASDAEYVLVDTGQEKLWLAEARVHDVLSKNEKYSVVQKVRGKALAGMEYEPLYTFMPLDGKKAHYVALANFVSLSDGTGIVHTAAIYGEDDYKLAVELDLPRVPTLDDQGKFLPFVTPISDVFYKKAEAWIIEDLTKRNLMLAALKIVHSYPFCYRCETPLYYSAVPAWFIDVAKMKKDLLVQNEHIHWYPGHLKHGRFGKGLETAPDWNISRSRYWGTPMPIWKNQKSNIKDQKNGKEEYRIIGSIEELKKWAVEPKKVDKLTDIHREYIDDIEIWMDEAHTVKGKRIPEVFDCWVESGSMPYASIHYPFEHEKEFEASHPAQFIAEYIAQTRAWFYTLHVMSVGLFGKYTFENAVTTGTILAEDGTKMSKSKKNYPDPSLLFEKYGVDALRFYLMGSVVMKAENVNFSEAQVKEIYQKLLTILWNIFSFYKLYAKNEVPSLETPKAVHDLDRWIVSKTHALVRTVTKSMDAYDTNSTCRALQEFVTDLSTWYLRRSRERLRVDQSSRKVFGWVIHTFVLLLSPLAPFLTERIYQNLGNTKSIHLAHWPIFDASCIDDSLEHAVEASRSVVETLLFLRKNLNIPVRQSLAKFYIQGCDMSLFRSYPGILQTILDEANIESVEESPKELAASRTLVSSKCSLRHIGDGEVFLDTQITQDLKDKGLARELLRKIQTVRKEKECTIDAHISLVLPKEYEKLPKNLLAHVKKEALVDSLTWGDSLQILTG